MHSALCVIAVFVCLQTWEAIAQPYKNQLPIEDNNICRTKACQKLTNLIRESVDPTVDACEDFYSYACGKRIAQKPVIPGKDIWSQPNLNEEILNRILRDLLNESISLSDNVAERWAKEQYRACMDNEQLEIKGVSSLMSVVKQIGNWPMISNDNMISNTILNMTWLKVHNFYNRLSGTPSLFCITVATNTIYMHRPTVFTSVPMRNNTMIRNYMNLIRKISQEFVDANQEENHIIPMNVTDSDVAKVFAFRRQLAWMRYFTFGAEKTVRTIDGLQQWFDAEMQLSSTTTLNISWLDIIQETFKDIKGITIHGKQEITIFHENYFAKLFQLIARTPQEVVLNHIHLHFVERHIQYTNSKMRNLLFAVQAKDMPADRSIECTTALNLREVISHMYIKRYFSPAAKATATDLVESIKQMMQQEILNTSSGSDEQTKRIADKLQDMVGVIGYDDWYMDDKKIVKFYERCNMGSDYLMNVLNYETVMYADKLSRLNASNIRKEDVLYPTVPDVLYSTEKNRFEITAAMLQWPYFDTDLPDVANYAGFGSLSGHEIARAFIKLDTHDAVAFQLDMYSSVEYNSSINCFATLYSSQMAESLNGQRTFTRNNIGKILMNSNSDARGMAIAYNTFKRKAATADINANKKLPDLDEYTNDQIFFLVNAVSKCEYAAHTDISRIFLSNYPTGRQRVNGPMSDMPSFSEAFNCSRSSIMNHVGKCSIWN
ncbi:hypothetical protein KM043_017042 [Ampulex compressa]|nr:hypothetical protein KM043_017042 [Ampulex compressa]